MPPTKDILSKIWLRRGSDGILSRRVCGGRIVQQLATEQPQILNLQADMLVRNERDEIHHIEFQSTNEADFALRMLRYFVYFRFEYRQPIHQTVFYIGKEPMRLDTVFEELRTVHRFDVVNLQDCEAGEIGR